MPNTQPAARFGSPVATLALLAALSGCAGRLENPERFLDRAATDATADMPLPFDAGGGDGGPCPGSLDYVPLSLFPRRCGTEFCHSASAMSAHLDLASPGMAQRLVGVATATTAQGGSCTGMLLLDPAHPMTGVLSDKLTTSPRCGSAMPLVGTHFSAAELLCVQAWIASLVPSAGVDGGMTATDARRDGTPE